MLLYKQGADPALGVEMSSTGEVACFGTDASEVGTPRFTQNGVVLPEL